MNAVDSSTLWEFTATAWADRYPIRPTACGSTAWKRSTMAMAHGRRPMCRSSGRHGRFPTAGHRQFGQRRLRFGGGGTASYANLCNPILHCPRFGNVVDKPPRLYVSQYTMNLNTSENDEQQLAYDGYVWATGFADSFANNYTWSDQAGGSGNWSVSGAITPVRRSRVGRPASGRIWPTEPKLAFAVGTTAPTSAHPLSPGNIAT